MLSFELPDGEFAAVTALVRRTIDENGFLFSLRLPPLKSALVKLHLALALKARPVLSPPPISTAMIAATLRKLHAEGNA